MNTVDTITYKGMEIEIHPEGYGEDFDPREWDNLGIMACFHNLYKLGDKHGFYNGKELIDYLKGSKAIWLPLYLIDHSGISMNTTGFSYCDPGNWDSGQVGIIYVDKEAIRREYDVKRINKKLLDKVISVLRGEVEVYNQYITGDMYWYSIEHTGDSCGGFYGHDWEKNGLLSTAHDNIDWYIEEQKSKHAKQLKTWIRNHVPLDKRYSFNI